MVIDTTQWVLRAASAAVLSSLLVLTACGGSSSDSDDGLQVEEPDPVLPPVVGDDLEQVISGAVLDKRTGSVINGATVRFIGNGAPATNVTDIDGNVITSATAPDGSFQVRFKEAGIDGFTLAASAEGYIESSTFVDTVTDDAVVTVQIALNAAAGTGVGATEKEAPVENATTGEEILADVDENVAPEDDTTVGSATVLVPAATQLQDASGNPVPGTSVKINIVFVEETDDQAAEAPTVAEAIPAGLNDVEGVAEVSVPLAVAQVKVTVTDTADNTTTTVKRSSQPIAITFNVPAATKLRSANRTVAEGDQFAVKSYNEEEGFWRIEDNKAIVGAEGPRGFPAILAVDHLTFFALTDGAAACDQPVNLTFNGDEIPASNLIVRLFSSDVEATFTARASDNPLAFTAAEAKGLGIAANAKAAVRVRDADGNVWGETPGEVPVCADVVITLENPIAEAFDETLTVTAVCSNDTTVTTALAGALVTYRADATKPYLVAPGNGDGTYSLTNLPSGTEYNVVVDTNLAGVSELQTTTITADGTGENLDVLLTCAGGTVTGGTGSSGG